MTHSGFASRNAIPAPRFSQEDLAILVVEKGALL
jgi:hypothetical protein